MDLSVALTAFGLVFAAELGDKTQLVAMSLAHRNGWAPTFLGLAGAFVVLDLLAVLVGTALFRYVPEPVVLVAAGLLFLAFAWRAWREAGEEEEDRAGPGRGARSAVLAAFLLIFVAELGDKTQLTLAALAAGTGEAAAVFVGGTLALLLASLLAVLLGAALLARLPPRAVHRTAALLFAVFGGLALWRALS